MSKRTDNSRRLGFLGGMAGALDLSDSAIDALDTPDGGFGQDAEAVVGDWKIVREGFLRVAERMKR